MRLVSTGLLLLAACRAPGGAPPASSEPGPAAGAASTRAQGSPSEPGVQPTESDAALRCADAWLRDHGLNEFGDPPDTVYAGGTPLFDEARGVRKDRAQLLLEKRPALREACPGLARDTAK